MYNTINPLKKRVGKRNKLQTRLHYIQFYFFFLVSFFSVELSPSAAFTGRTFCHWRAFLLYMGHGGIVNCRKLWEYFNSCIQIWKFKINLFLMQKPNKTHNCRKNESSTKNANSFRKLLNYITPHESYDLLKHPI